MLRVPEIDDITYDQIIERAVNKIPTMTDKWTDFNASDPGITVLQTYAWLVDMLNYYMNATGDVHVEKYLKLLGVKKIKKQAADTTICFDSELDHVNILKGTECHADDVTFQVKENEDFIPNKFISFINEVDHNAIDLTAFAGADGDFANIFADKFDEYAAGYFGFSKKLQGKVNLYISVGENERRNPNFENFSFGDLKWQYYTEDGFKDLQVLKDETCGLLKSGIITFAATDGDMISMKHEANGMEAFYIRCVLNDNFYDKLPRIGKIFANPIAVEQTKTLCRTETLKYTGNLEMPIPGYVDKDVFFMVGLQQMDGSFRVIYNYSSATNKGCDIVDGEIEGSKILVLSEPYDCLARGTKIQVNMISMEALPYFTIGTASGCNNQKIEFDYDDVYKLSVNLWETRANGMLCYRPYNQVDDIHACNYDDYAFSYDYDDKCLEFGDAIHGALPKKGQVICLAELVTSKLDRGNVMAKGINSISYGEEGSCQVYNPNPATGGRDEETVEEMMERLLKQLLTQNRLVSEKDYLDTVTNIPGLMIDMVTVIPDREYAAIHNRQSHNDQILVVKPYSMEKTPALSEIYRNKILEYIEPLRLINTKIDVVSPSYVGIEVHAKIHMKNQSEEDKQAIIDIFEEELSYEKQKNAFGHKIILGRLFTKLDALEGVKFIEHLSLERIGQGAEKNDRGDIILHRDALSYVKDFDIEYVLH